MAFGEIDPWCYKFWQSVKFLKVYMQKTYRQPYYLSTSWRPLTPYTKERWSEYYLPTTYPKQQFYGHLPPIMKTLQVKWTRHCWWSRDKLIKWHSCGPLHMDEQRQYDQLEPIYSSSVPIQDVALKTCRKQWTRKGQGYLCWWYDMMMMVGLLDIPFNFVCNTVSRSPTQSVITEQIVDIIKRFSPSLFRWLQTLHSSWNYTNTQTICSICFPT